MNIYIVLMSTINKVALNEWYFINIITIYYT